MKQYSQMLNQVLNKEVLLTLITRLLILAFGFASTVITAHFLSPAGRGGYYYVVSLANIIAQFCNLGLASSNTYLVAKKNEYLHKLLVNSLWVSIVFTGLISLVISSLHHFDYLLVTALAPAIVYYLLSGNLLIGVGKIKIYNFLQLFSNFLICLLLILTGIFYGTASSMLAAVVMGWVISGIITTAIFLQQKNTISFKFDLQLFKTGFSFSLKAYISTFLGILIQRGGIFFITSMLSMKIAGYFSIASQLNDTLAILPTSIAMVLFPTLIKQTDNRWRHTKLNLLTTGILMLLICIAAFVFAKPFITLVFGERYFPAIEIFYWMLPGAFFYALTGIVSQYLSAIGFPKMQVGAWVAAVAVFFIGNNFLIPWYGAVGSAMALSVTFLFLFSALLYLATREEALQQTTPPTLQKMTPI